MFLAGATTTAAGLAVFTTTVDAPIPRLLASAGLASVAFATLVWTYEVLAVRLSLPAEDYVQSSAAVWTFPAYSLLTLGARVLFGACHCLVRLASLPSRARRSIGKAFGSASRSDAV